MKKILFSCVIFFLIPVSSSFAQEADEDLISLFASEEAFSGKIFIEAERISKKIIKVDVKSLEINTPTIGIAFHLKYEEGILNFLKYEPGEFLETGGDPIYLVKNIAEQGKIIFGSTLTHQDTFPIGGDKLVSFYFETTTSQNEFLFEFERGFVSSTEEVMQDIINVDWQDFYGAILENQSENEGINNSSLEKKQYKIALYTAVFCGSTILIVGLVFIFIRRQRLVDRTLIN